MVRINEFPERSGVGPLAGANRPGPRLFPFSAGKPFDDLYDAVIDAEHAQILAGKSIGELFGGVRRQEIAVYRASGRRGNRPQEELEYLQQLVSETGFVYPNVPEPSALTLVWLGLILVRAAGVRKTSRAGR